MTTTPAPEQPDLDAEREIDVGRYLDALVARWWLPVAGLAVGIVLGYLLALGGKQVFQAQATVYVGTPYGPGGNVAIQSLATNPNTVSQIAHGQETILRVARESGLSARELRAGISVAAIKNALLKTLPSQLYTISVKGGRRAEVTSATDLLAQRVVDVVGGYATLKIKTLLEELASDDRQLAAIKGTVSTAETALRGASGVERLTTATLLLTAEQRRGSVQQDRLVTQQLLALARQVELPQVIDHAAATKTTARSTRNSAAVAGLIGLVLGLLAALFWEPVATRMGRTT